MIIILLQSVYLCILVHCRIKSYRDNLFIHMCYFIKLKMQLNIVSTKHKTIQQVKIYFHNFSSSRKETSTPVTLRRRFDFFSYLSDNIYVRFVNTYVLINFILNACLFFFTGACRLSGNSYRISWRVPKVPLEDD